MHTYLGVDIGTSAVKVLLVSGDGTVLDSRSASYGTDSPRHCGTSKTPLFGGTERSPVSTHSVSAMKSYGSMSLP